MTMPLPSNDRCVMCGAPLRAPLGRGARLCGSLLCASRHAAVPSLHTCAVCTAPLTAAQWAGRVCARSACRVEWLVRRPVAAREAAVRAEIARATASRDRMARRLGMASEEGQRYRVVVTPRNVDRTSRLPALRRQAFEAHLRRALTLARARLAAGESVAAAPPRTAPATSGAVDDGDALPREALFTEVCATCRGACCRPGGDTAFLGAESMRRYLARFPEQDDDTVVATYLSFVGARTMTHGCVYQRTDGCSLPRELRSDTCNRYYCDAFASIREPYGAGEPVRAYLMRRGPSGLEGGRFVQIEVRGTATAAAVREERRR